MFLCEPRKAERTLCRGGYFVGTAEIRCGEGRRKTEWAGSTNKKSGEADCADRYCLLGDSLTAGGGWTSTLQKLSGIPVYNGGTGGENARTIAARQGADVMLVNNITIPATCEPVTIAVRKTDSGILTEEGYKVTPLLQGGAHVNPVKIGEVEGTLRWTGTNYADTNGIWTFTRSAAGEAVTIKRPTAVRTAFDRLHNQPSEVMILSLVRMVAMQTLQI